jgi:Ca-activated chloride channel family protein
MRSSMSSVSSARISVLLWAIILSVSLAAAQDDPFNLNIDVRNVSVGVSVFDTSGRPVTKLTKSDFSIFENGVQQEIQTFESVETPYNILIVVDCSGSTEADWPLMGKAIDQFAAALPPQDRVSVVQFGKNMETLLDWQAPTGKSLRVGMSPSSSTCSSTDFYGALTGSLGKFKGTKGRKGVVMLTDGVQTPFPLQRMIIEGHMETRYANAADDGEFQKALRDVSRSEVVFYFAAVNTDLNPDPITSRGRYGIGLLYNPEQIYNMQQARSRMMDVAEATGGSVAYPKKPEEIGRLYEDIARKLGTQYGLWYRPKESAQGDSKLPRKIAVKVNVPNVRLEQSRTEYIPGER